VKRKVVITLPIVIAAVVLLYFYFFWGSNVPKGQQPLVRLDSSNITSLKDAFNSSSNDVRLIVMLSPT